MKRRTFLANSTALTASLPFWRFTRVVESHYIPKGSLFDLFSQPGDAYKPFVRWWWNGGRVRKDEISRELQLLKAAGIGGVEINPIKFPARTPDLGISPVAWLSEEWLSLLEFATDEAKRMGLQCDLIVGSGWPYGSEEVPEEERSEIMVIATKKLVGPLDYVVSTDELIQEADPPISSPFPGRKMQLVSVSLVPGTLQSMDQVVDLSSQISSGSIRVSIPAGLHVLYGLVRINGFMQVIQGAPGANGPVLDHYDKAAVNRFLNKMSEGLRKLPGRLQDRFRSLFTDSLELEGANWSKDLAAEFIRRRGYDIVSYLPFILFRIGAMGNTWNYDHGAVFGKEFEEMIQRMRFDFELTRTELLEERFAATFRDWCNDLGLKSRMQAYGRGYFPLEGSWDPDIPEGETWIRKGLGLEMNEREYMVGRAYTVVNKYVSSAAHLQGKKLISCEELTNIHQVFNETLELMKVGADQSTISGMTHAVFHGYNYSPPEASFPGWVVYGSYFSDRNPWWPYLEKFTAYKTRLSALFQQGTMYADVAILPPTADLWSRYASQNDPFPAVMYPGWFTFLWESIHQNGAGCDYVSETIIQQGQIEKGHLRFRERRYRILFLAKVSSLSPATAQKLYELASAGLTIFCIGEYPSRSTGWKDHGSRDQSVQSWMEKLKALEFRCFLLDEPTSSCTRWMAGLLAEIRHPVYLRMDQPNPFVSQVRYQFRDADAVFIANSNLQAEFSLDLQPARELRKGRQAWRWDPETGKRYRIKISESGWIHLELGPAESVLLMFDHDRGGEWWETPEVDQGKGMLLDETWELAGHSIDGTRLVESIPHLHNISERKNWVGFCGNLIYHREFDIPAGSRYRWLSLGKVNGVAEVIVNEKNAGVKWAGTRLIDVGRLLQTGRNSLQIRVTTTPGNFLKADTTNAIGQYWTNEGRTVQPIQAAGIEGPVVLY